MSYSAYKLQSVILKQMSHLFFAIHDLMSITVFQVKLYSEFNDHHHHHHHHHHHQKKKKKKKKKKVPKRISATCSFGSEVSRRLFTSFSLNRREEIYCNAIFYL